MPDLFSDGFDAAPAEVRMTEYDQLRRNLTWLARHDLHATFKELTMADATINEVIDSVQATEAELIPALQALVADDATQKQRADALQAAADALAASGSVVDATHAQVLRGISSGFASLLSTLVPVQPPASASPGAPASPAVPVAAPAAGDPVPTPAQTPVPTPAPAAGVDVPTIPTPAPTDATVTASQVPGQAATGPAAPVSATDSGTLPTSSLPA